MGLFKTLLFGTIGAMVGGPVGAVVGAVIAQLGAEEKQEKSGGASAEAGKQRRRSNAEADQTRLAFIVTLFSCLAKLSKIDGRVSRIEADFVADFMKKNFNREERKIICEIFNTARDNQEPASGYINQLNTILGSDKAMKESFLNLFCRLAQADGTLTSSELDFLRYTETVFQLNGYVDHFFASRKTPRRESSKPLALYYRLLEIPGTATDTEVKKAYRRKCVEFHPDRLTGKGLPPQFIHYAEEEMIKINEAYSAICKARGI